MIKLKKRLKIQSTERVKGINGEVEGKWVEGRFDFGKHDKSLI